MGTAPMMNPTGSNGWGQPSTAMPSPGGPGNYGYGNGGNTNPTTTTGNPWMPTPNVSPNPGYTLNNSGPFGTPGANNYTGMSASLGNQLGKIYGTGVGGELYQYLQTGAGYNGPLTQQAINSQIAGMQNNINLGYGNLQTQEGASGVSPNSSVAALENSNYFSNAVTQENAITAQEYYNMWNQSMSNETSTLNSILDPASKQHANSGILGQISSWLGLGSSAMQGAGEIGQGLDAAGVGTGAVSGGIVDFLAAL